MNAQRYWYLHNKIPIQVLAEQTSDKRWYLPELNISVDGADLFRTSTGVLKSLRRQITAEIERRQKEKPPHPDATPTKARYLWLIEGDKE